MATMTVRPSAAGHAPESIAISDEEDDWIVQYRAELQVKQQERLAELRKQAQDELGRKRSDPNANPRELEIAKENYNRSLAAVKQMLKDEEDAMIEREKQLRLWSKGDTSEFTEQFKREQQAIWDNASGKSQHGNGADEQRRSTDEKSPRDGVSQQFSLQDPSRTTSRQQAHFANNARHAMPSAVWNPPTESSYPIRSTERSVSGSSTGSLYAQSYRTEASSSGQSRPSTGSLRSKPPSVSSPAPSIPSWMPEEPSHLRTIHSEPEHFDADEDSRSEGESDSYEEGDDEEEEEYDGEQEETAGPSNNLRDMPAKSAPWSISSESLRPSVTIGSHASTSASPSGHNLFWRPSTDNLRGVSTPNRATNSVSPGRGVEHSNLRDNTSHPPPTSQWIPAQRTHTVSFESQERLAELAEREAAALREADKKWASIDRSKSYTFPPASVGPSPPHQPSPYPRNEYRPRVGSTETEHSSQSHSASNFRRPSAGSSPIPMPATDSMKKDGEFASKSHHDSSPQQPQIWKPQQGPSSVNPPTRLTSNQMYSTPVGPTRSPDLSNPVTPPNSMRFDGEISRKNPGINDPRVRSSGRQHETPETQGLNTDHKASLYSSMKDPTSATHAKLHQTSPSVTKGFFTPSQDKPSAIPLSRQPTEEFTPSPLRGDYLAPRHFSPEADSKSEDANDEDDLDILSSPNFDSVSLFDMESANGSNRSSASSEVEEQQRKKEEELRRSEEALKEREAEVQRQILELAKREKALREREEEEKRKADERFRKEEAEREAEREKERKRQDDMQRKLEEEHHRKMAEQHKREIAEQEERLRFFNLQHQETQKKKSESSPFAQGPKPPGSTASTSASFSSAYSHAGSTTGSSSGSTSSSSTRGGSQRSTTSASESVRSAGSAWSSSTRANSASSASTSSTPRDTPPKSTGGAWKPSGTSGSTTSSYSSTRNASSSANANVPLSESERQRRQEEHARKQQEQFQREQMRKEQEHQAKAAKLSPREEVVNAWSNYEAGWAAMKDRTGLLFATMPWPILKKSPTIEDLTANTIGNFILSPHHSSEKAPRDRLKEQLLRWHPDRFEARCLPRIAESDREAVKSGMDQVVRGLNELMARETSSIF